MRYFLLLATLFVTSTASADHVSYSPYGTSSHTSNDVSPSYRASSATTYRATSHRKPKCHHCNSAQYSYVNDSGYGKPYVYGYNQQGVVSSVSAFPDLNDVYPYDPYYNTSRYGNSKGTRYHPRSGDPVPNAATINRNYTYGVQGSPYAGFRGNDKEYKHTHVIRTQPTKEWVKVNPVTTNHSHDHAHTTQSTTRTQPQYRTNYQPVTTGPTVYRSTSTYNTASTTPSYKNTTTTTHSHAVTSHKAPADKHYYSRYDRYNNHHRMNHGW